MASYNELNALIDAYINRNGVQAITGQILNGVLKAMVEQLGRGYTIMGAAAPTTDPGTPDGPESWFASTPGIYTRFDGIEVASAELALLSYTPTTGWEKVVLTEGINQVDAIVDGNVGTPAVSVSYENGVLSFDFRNMKGETGATGPRGNTGAAAGFGTVQASVDGNTGTPEVTVNTSGPDTAKNISFVFKNLKGARGARGERGETGARGPFGPRGLRGEKGDKGDTGDTGPRGATGPQGLKGDKGDKGNTGAAAGFGTPVASVDANIGTPSVTITASGPNTAKVFTFAFHNLKGETGAQGEQGIQGPQGEKGDKGDKGDPGVDIYNGLDSDATDEALAAAQGKVLDEKITTSDGVISEALAWVDERIKLLEARLTDEYNRIKVYAKDIHAEDIYQYEVPAVLECSTAGAPAAARIPDNWDLDTMGVWSGVPRFIGQEYVDKVSKKVYKAVTLTNSTNDWVILN